jgi:hypothetical protein
VLALSFRCKRISAKPNAQIVGIQGLPEIRKVVLTNGAEANPSTPQGLREFVRPEVVTWTATAKAAGMTPQQ